MGFFYNHRAIIIIQDFTLCDFHIEDSILLQCDQLFRGADSHLERAREAFLHADRATDAQRGVRERNVFLVEMNRQIRTAGAVSARGAQFGIHDGGDLFYW
jgi:hypothetical protein